MQSRIQSPCRARPAQPVAARAQLGDPAKLRVTATLAEGGRASLVIAQQAWLGDTLLCEGTIRIGWVDAAAMKPARIPSSVLERLT